VEGALFFYTKILEAVLSNTLKSGTITVRRLILIKASLTLKTMTDDQNGQYTGGFSMGNQGGQSGQTGGTPNPPVPPPVQPPVQPYAAPVPPIPPVPPAPPLPPVGAPGGVFPPPPPPPPPAGDPNYVFGVGMASFTTTVKLPAHQLQVDEPRFINLLAGSISLTKDEKKKIVDTFGKLRQAQVDELIRIFVEEREKFVELSSKHSAQLKKLEKEHIADWRDIELSYKSAAQSQEDESKADDIRKQLGL
jgi:hypothetical protein